MGTRINEFVESMEEATGEDLRMFMFTRPQLRLLQQAVKSYLQHVDRESPTAKAWVEAFDPDWKE